MTPHRPIPQAVPSPGRSAPSRSRDLRRGVALEGLTVAWNAVECGVAAASGVAAGSAVLLGYASDSLLEMTSAVLVGLRLWRELGGRVGTRLERDERSTARAAGALLVALALLVTAEAVRRLLGTAAHPGESVPGIVLTLIAALSMPWLGAAKLRLALRLGSRALRLEAEQTIACAFFSVATLAGLLLNALFGWWWADPLAAIALVPWLVREGLEPWLPERPAAREARPSRGRAAGDATGRSDAGRGDSLPAGGSAEASTTRRANPRGRSTRNAHVRRTPS